MSTFLTDLADECERSGTEFGKGRAHGIRETIREFQSIPYLAPGTDPAKAMEDIREALQYARETIDSTWNKGQHAAVTMLDAALAHFAPRQEDQK